MTPQLTFKALKKVFEPAGSAFAAFLCWIIFQYVFKMDFKCPCDINENTRVCAVYMSLPTISLFIVMMIIDKHIRNIFCSNGTVKPWKKWKCIVFFMSIINALSVACLWIITVLMDGDWYVCLKTTKDNLKTSEQTFCKMTKTAAENADIKVHESISRVSTLFICFE